MLVAQAKCHRTGFWVVSGLEIGLDEKWNRWAKSFFIVFHQFVSKFQQVITLKQKELEGKYFGGLIVLLWATKRPSNSAVAQN